MLTGRGHKVSVLAVDPSSCTTGGKPRLSYETDEALLSGALQCTIDFSCLTMFVYVLMY